MIKQVIGNRDSFFQNAIPADNQKAQSIISSRISILARISTASRIVKVSPVIRHRIQGIKETLRNPVISYKHTPLSNLSFPNKSYHK